MVPCESGNAIFEWRVTWSYVYSPFNKCFRSNLAHSQYRLNRSTSFLHNISASRDFHNPSAASRDLNHLSASRDAHNLSASRDAHNLSASRDAHNLSTSRDAHNLSASSDLHNSSTADIPQNSTLRYAWKKNIVFTKILSVNRRKCSEKR